MVFRCDGKYTLHIFSSEFIPQKYLYSKSSNARFGLIVAKHLDPDKIAYATQASEMKNIFTSMLSTSINQKPCIA